jgi:hypothetical protein
MNKREIKKLLRGKTREQNEQFLREVNQFSSRVQLLTGFLDTYNSMTYLADGLKLLYMNEEQLISKFEVENYDSTEAKYEVIKNAKCDFDKVVSNFGLSNKLSMMQIEYFCNELIEELGFSNSDNICRGSFEEVLDFLIEKGIELFYIDNWFNDGMIHYTAALPKEEFIKRFCEAYFEVKEA